MRFFGHQAVRACCVVTILLVFTGAICAGTFSDLVVFGDSLSDVGNINSIPLAGFPGSAYWHGRFSNGPVYAERLAMGLGLSPLSASVYGGDDYAYGGGRATGKAFPLGLVIKDVDDQVDEYLADHDANGRTLYVVFAGANDLIDGQTNMNVPVLSLAGSINRLIDDGARNFLVFNLPPMGSTPRYNDNPVTQVLYNTRSEQFNNKLAAAVFGMRLLNPTVSFYQFDVAGLMNRAIANPAAFGLANVTDPAAPGLEPGVRDYDTSQIASNPNQYLFWDELHPTTAMHAILARRALDLFRLPGDFNEDGVVNLADYIVWRRGLGTNYVADDLTSWREHFGRHAGGSGALAAVGVPEPGGKSLGLAAGIVIIVMLSVGRQHRQRRWASC